MRLLSYDVPRNWNYFLFGDSHVGAALRHGKGWRKLVRMMKGKYEGLPASCNFGTDHGDIIEAIMVDDKRYSIFESREQTVLAQIEAAKKELWPIKDRIVAILDGNHPRKLHNFGTITKYVCDQLTVSYGTYSCKITFINKGKQQFKHFAFHGAGSISSVADDPGRRDLNRCLSLKRKLSPKAADCKLMSMGHTHQILMHRPSEVLYLTDDGKETQQHYNPPQTKEYIHPDYRWYCNTGGFLKLYGDVLVEDDDVPMEQSKLGSGYAEVFGYQPLSLGFLVVLIRDNEIKDIKIEYI